MKIKAFLIAIFSIPIVLSAQTVSPRTGFVEKAIWFSEETLASDKTVKIYTAVFNGEDSRLTVKVDFIDGNVALSSKEVVINPNETKTVSADFKVSLGSHEIYAIISSAKINGESVLLESLKTDSVKFSVTKEVPGSVVKNALLSKLGGVFEGEGTFKEKADAWFKLNFKKSEEFRESTLKKIKDSEQKVEKSREEEKKDVKTSVKVISFLHFYSLIILGFLFSVSFIFYICVVLIIYLLLRLVWKIIRRIFRRKYEE
jgi:hypothetical protein